MSESAIRSYTTVRGSNEVDVYTGTTAVVLMLGKGTGPTTSILFAPEDCRSIATMLLEAAEGYERAEAAAAASKEAA